MKKLIASFLVVMAVAGCKASPADKEFVRSSRAYHNAICPIMSWVIADAINWSDQTKRNRKALLDDYEANLRQNEERTGLTVGGDK